MALRNWAIAALATGLVAVRRWAWGGAREGRL